MNKFNNILFENEDGIGVVTINRPQALNALNTVVLDELNTLCDVISGDTTVKVVIITGAGNKSFVAGADIVEMCSLDAQGGRAFARFGQLVFSKIENIPQPVIAAVDGFALGGGCELAMACDVRIASEKAKFGQPEVALGITPGYGGTQRLSRLIGNGRAKELIFSGDVISAAEAYRIGLVNKVVSQSDLMNTAKELARKIISRSQIAVQLSKTAINKGADMAVDSGIAYEAEVFSLCFAAADQKEGMTAFLEKRNPTFK